MASLDELLRTEEEPAARASLDELLASDDQRSSRGFKEPTAKEIADLEAYNNQVAKEKERPWWESVKTGMYDPLVGVGQLAQNVLPDAVLNVGRKVTDPIVNAVMGGDVDTSNTSTEDFNAMVRRREQYIQADRGEAAKEGLDWWRVGGNVANPMTWLGPKAEGKMIMEGIKSGAFQALLQPVATEGNYLWDKSMQAGIGAAIGGTLGAALQTLKSPLSAGVKFARKVVGASDEQAHAAAGKVVDDTLQAAKVDPKKMDPSLYSAIRQEVGDAMKAGVDPDPRVIANRADASALPVPMRLTRGEASGDPVQFAKEWRISGMEGVGEPLSALKNESNRLLIENLNELGAKNAPAPFDASQALISRIQGIDDQLKSQVDKAYAAVRDSAGRPARMDHMTFVKRANDAIDQGQLGPYLPAQVRQQLNDIAEGKLPLTVNVAQQLDKVWGATQRGTQDGSAKMAIGQLRTALNDAPVADALGQDSMAAYKAARQLAKQRFSLIDSNPAYKAVTEGIEPDKFFQKYVQGANVSDLRALKQLVGPEDTKMLQQTLIGNLKRAAVKGTDERGVFSQSAYNRVLQDPVQMPRLRELFADDVQTLDQLYRVGRVAELKDRVPAGSRVNFSNTASSSSNIVRDIGRSKLTEALWGTTRLGPVRQLVKEAKERSAISSFVDEAVNPGVTPQPLPKPISKPTSRLSALGARAGVAAASPEEREE